MSTTLDAPAKLDREQMLRLYREMVNIRKTEEQLARSYQQGNIPGACHTYIGQEAIAAGVCAHLSHEDVVFSTHRGHGHALAKGVPPKEVIAELFGKATGVSRGRGGSMHLFSPEVGLLGTTGIVGPNVLQATGAGYAFKLLNQSHVSVAFFGDGAMNNGSFHEGVNMGAIWDLPVIYVCENNMYATEVPFAYATKNQHVAERAATYGIEAVAVDGNDVIAVWEAARDAAARARAGKGPTLIEARTYRPRPHAEGMRDAGYRTQDEIDAWKTRDPITSLKAQMLAEGIATEADFDAIDADITAIVADALTFAQESPFPDPATATLFVYGAES